MVTHVIFVRNSDFTWLGYKFKRRVKVAILKGGGGGGVATLKKCGGVHILKKGDGDRFLKKGDSCGE